MTKCNDCGLSPSSCPCSDVDAFFADVADLPRAVGPLTDPAEEVAAYYAAKRKLRDARASAVSLDSRNWDKIQAARDARFSGRCLACWFNPCRCSSDGEAA